MTGQWARAILTAVGAAVMMVNGVQADEPASAPLFPGADYDTAVPTLEQVIGHPAGTRITLPENAIRYLEALEAAYPERVRLFDYGRTWEGRRLVYAAISSAQNISRLDALKDGMTRLSDPQSTSDKEAEALIADLPAPVWLAYSVHGNEISSTDAALQVAYHLLASRGDDRIEDLMTKTVVFLNPTQNPDGRARFINRFRSTMGMKADSDPISAEHNEPWPSGRTNHYLFDMNRDWIALTQPETRGHIEALREWKPVVFVDLHEMGSNSTYYFAPEAVPYNPHLAPSQRENLFLFGKTNAKWFDRFGLPYFTRDVYDAFYPGYGASWPAYYGAVAMTYEQASSRGLTYRRLDGSEFNFIDTIRGHFLTSLATIETAATNRGKLLSDFWQYQKTAIEEGRTEDGKRYYVFPISQPDRAGVRKLAGNLAAMGVQVSQTRDDRTRACGRTLGAGSVVISAVQPAKRLLRTLLEPQVDMDPDWVAEQERKRQKDIGHDIYDVTAWSLPKMYNLSMLQCDRVDLAEVAGVEPYAHTPGTITGDENAVVYLVPWGDMAAGRFLTQALKSGITLKSHNEGFTLKGRAYPRGTLIVEAARNAPSLRNQITQIARDTGADVVASESTWVDAGKDLGSRAVQPLYPIRIAMAWDEPTSQYSAGNTRFVIERQFGYPVTIVRPGLLARADLSRYHVLILPDGGGYMSALGEAGTENLKDWVANGGVLIAQGRAMRYLAHEKTGFLATEKEDQAREEAGDSDDRLVIETADQFARLITPDSESPDSVPGALVYGTADPDHDLTAGVANPLHILVRGSDIYSPLALDDGDNLVTFQSADTLLSSGYLWEENKAQLAFKPFMMSRRMGRGMVIGFTQDPTVRAYLDGLNILYMNAIFRAAGQARPVR